MTFKFTGHLYFFGNLQLEFTSSLKPLQWFPEGRRMEKMPMLEHSFPTGPPLPVFSHLSILKNHLLQETCEQL